MKRVSLLMLMLLIVVGAVGATLQDPTRPTTAIVQGEGSYGIIVSSILYSHERHIAIINGEYVKEGDTVQGAKVIKIRPDSVVFRSEQKEFYIPVHTSVKHKLVNKVGSHDQK